MTTQLALYEHARDALAEAVRFDEVTRIHSAAEQAKAYARIAKDKKLLADAAELVARAERKLGIMLRRVKEDGLLSKGGRPADNSNVSQPETGTDAEPVFDNTPFTLADIGIDKKLSSRAQKAAALDDDAFEDGVQAEREKILASGAPVVSPPKARVARDATPVKPEPLRPLEPRRWHQFAFSVLSLTMASDRVSSAAIHKLAEHCGIVALDGDEVDFTPEAIEAMGSLATAALKALDGEAEGAHERARLREAYEGEIALLAPQKGKLTMKLAQAAMRAGYAAEVPLVLMSQDLGHPHGTIATWANRLGLTSAARMHATQQRFGDGA